MLAFTPLRAARYGPLPLIFGDDYMTILRCYLTHTFIFPCHFTPLPSSKVVSFNPPLPADSFRASISSISGCRVVGFHLLFSLRWHGPQPPWPFDASLPVPDLPHQYHTVPYIYFSFMSPVFQSLPIDLLAVHPQLLLPLASVCTYCLDRCHM